MSQLIPALAATVGPALPLLTAAVLMRGDTIRGARHRADTVKPVPADWTPYDSRVRAAARHYASHTREAGLSTGAAA